MNLTIKDLHYLAGYFNSDLQFPNMKKSPQRPVDAYELEFFSEDCVTFINGERCELPAGSILCAQPGMVRCSLLPFRNTYLKLQDSGGDIAAFLQTLPLVLRSERIPVYCAHIYEILAGQEQSNHWRIMQGIMGVFSELQSELDAGNRQVTYISDKYTAIAARAVDYMKAHLSQSCTLADIAAAVHFSPVYFHTVFSRVQGETPLACLTRLRIEKAKLLLMTENLAPDVIASKCGFSSETYFSAVFKKHTALTPRQYRSRMMKNYSRRVGSEKSE